VSRLAGRRQVVLALALLLGACTPPAALPPAPPPQSAAQLARWRTPPPLETEPQIDLHGDLQRVALGNGLHVTVVARAESPSTVVRLWVPSASEESHGPLVVVAEMLRAGTQLEHGELVVNPRLGESAIGISTGRRGTEFEWQVLPRASQHAVALLGQFVLQPSFEPEELKLQMQRELTIIEGYSKSYRRVNDVARSALPGIAVPRPDRAAARLVELTREQVQHLYRCNMRPEGAELVIVGPVASEAALGWARRAFADWKPGARMNETGCKRPASPAAPASVALSEPLVQLLSGSRGEPYLFLALPGPARGAEDFLVFELLSRVLQDRDRGSARALRHTGTTAGIEVEVHSQYPGFSLLELHGQVEARGVLRALQALVLDLQRLEQDLTEAELDTAKRRWSAEYLDGLRSDSVLAASVSWELTRGRSPEAVYDWPRTLRAIDLERCRQVARRWLSPAQPSIVVTNPPSALGESLGFPATVRRLNWTWRASDDE
jgi:predicted Zn-dependent peptidase